MESQATRKKLRFCQVYVLAGIEVLYSFDGIMIFIVVVVVCLGQETGFRDRHVLFFLKFYYFEKEFACTLQKIVIQVV